MRTDGFKALGVGLLTVGDNKEAKEVLPPSGYVAQDNVKSQELFNQTLRAVTSEYGVLEIDFANPKAISDGWNVPLAVKNIGSQTVRVLGLLLNDRPYQALKAKVNLGTSQVVFPLEIIPSAERKLDLFIPFDSSFERNASIQIDVPVDDGLEKGFSVYLSNPGAKTN